MSLQNKYQKALDLGKEYQVANGSVKEENGKLKIGGTAKYQYQKDMIWDELKKAGGDNLNDVEVNIQVSDNSVYGYHEVRSGDSLSKIAKLAYGDPSKYTKIFEANRNILSDPDKIQPGQRLVIPN